MNKEKNNVRIVSSFKAKRAAVFKSDTHPDFPRLLPYVLAMLFPFIRNPFTYSPDPLNSLKRGSPNVFDAHLLLFKVIFSLLLFLHSIVILFYSIPPVVTVYRHRALSHLKAYVFFSSALPLLTAFFNYCYANVNPFIIIHFIHFCYGFCFFRSPLLIIKADYVSVCLNLFLWEEKIRKSWIYLKISKPS